jgi:hypothetical protein
MNASRHKQLCADGLLANDSWLRADRNARMAMVFAPSIGSIVQATWTTSI